MDDRALMGYFNALPEKCIALLEDIDVAMDGTLNRDEKDADGKKKKKKKTTGK